MLKRKLILTGLLTTALMTPAAAQAGWPTYDVAKLASLISNLAARYQPIAGLVQRTEQLAEMKKQIEAAGKAAMSGDVKSMGKVAGKALKSDSFSSIPPLPHEKKAKNGGSAQEVTDVLWDTYFFKQNENPSQAQMNEKRKARELMRAKVELVYKAKSLYYTNKAKSAGEERVKKIENAMEKAGTLQDAVNANTVAVMSLNFERLDQVSMMVSQLQREGVRQLYKAPFTRMTKPEPPEFGAEAEKEMGSLKVKDEADVDL